jgi:hypothetical protein
MLVHVDPEIDQPQLLAPAGAGLASGSSHDMGAIR